MAVMTQHTMSHITVYCKYLQRVARVRVEHSPFLINTLSITTRWSGLCSVSDMQVKWIQSEWVCDLSVTRKVSGSGDTHSQVFFHFTNTQGTEHKAVLEWSWTVSSIVGSIIFKNINQDKIRVTHLCSCGASVVSSSPLTPIMFPTHMPRHCIPLVL